MAPAAQKVLSTYIVERTVSILGILILIWGSTPLDSATLRATLQFSLTAGDASVEDVLSK